MVHLLATRHSAGVSRHASEDQPVRWILSLAAIALIGLGACLDPSSPDPLVDCESGTPPDSTWYIMSFQGVTVSGTNVVWNEDSGTLWIDDSFPSTGQDFVAQIVVDPEPMPSGSEKYCGELRLRSFELSGLNIFEFDPDSSHNDLVQLGYLSRDEISGGIFTTLFPPNNFAQQDTVHLLFSVEGQSCDLPSTDAYTIEYSGWELEGTRTQFSPSLGIIALGEDEEQDETPPAGQPKVWGMTLTVLGAPREFGSGEVLTLTGAQLTVADSTEGTPAQINPRTYAFPPEAGYNTDENSLVRVTDLGSFGIVGSARIPMQRQTFNPTSGIEWGEEVNVFVCFDAQS
jgi:hypothetical protein